MNNHNRATLSSNPAELLYEIVDCVIAGEPIPYYITGSIYTALRVHSGYEIGGVLRYILSLPEASAVLSVFRKLDVFEVIFPDLQYVIHIPQSKAKSKNVFDHIMNVIDVVPEDDINMRWVALLHDLGKIITYTEKFNFLNHERFSVQMARRSLDRFDIANQEEIVETISNHMLPLDYQRNPNWNDETVFRYITKHMNVDSALRTIEFAIYDKKAENDYESYLKPLYELRERVNNARANISETNGKEKTRIKRRG